MAPANATAERKVLAAEEYSVGDWHLRQPVSVLASARPDLWQSHRFDAGGGDRAAMTIGSRYADASDRSFGSSHLAFIGPRPKAKGGNEHAEDVFAPDVTIALGEKAMQVFTPSLPSSATAPELGTVNFTLEVPLRDSREEEHLKDLHERLNDKAIDAAQRERIEEDLRKQGAAPKTLRIEQHTSRVAAVLAEGRLLGYVLGDVPRESADAFYKGLQRLVHTHLGLR